MAVGALECAEVTVVAELGLTHVSFEVDICRFEVLMAFSAVTGGSERFLAVMAGSAGLPIFHIFHGVVLCACLIRENSCVAILAAVHRNVDIMAEKRVGNAFAFERDIFRFHSTMTLAAVSGNREGTLAVVAGAAGTTFLHLGHCYAPVLTGENPAVMAAFTFTAGCLVVDFVAERRFGGSFDLVDEVLRLSCMTFGAVFFVGNAEGLDPCMTAAA